MKELIELINMFDKFIIYNNDDDFYSLINKSYKYLEYIHYINNNYKDSPAKFKKLINDITLFKNDINNIIDKELKKSKELYDKYTNKTVDDDLNKLSKEELIKIIRSKK